MWPFLHRTRHPIRCTSVIGGESGDLLLRLLGDTLGDNHAYFRVAGETRLNATLLQKSPPTQYEVDSRGPEIPPTLLEDLSNRFLADCGAGIAILTGSVPPGVPEDHYRKLAERVKAQGGRAVIDAYGPVLQEALRAQPYLVRLNRYVMEMNIKRRLENIEGVAMAAREVQQRGIEFVCISLASEGAILSGQEQLPLPRTARARPLNRRLRRCDGRGAGRRALSRRGL
jgi:6-phosphofructokinase 2